MKKNTIWSEVAKIENQEIFDSYEKLETLHLDQKNKELMIEVKNLKCQFKTMKGKKVIFENVSFNIYKGELIAFLGPNGAGKTLTVEILSGSRHASGGEIIYHFDHKKGNPYEHIGVQFQDSGFPNSLTVKDMIDFILRLNNVTKMDVTEFDHALETFQLKSILNSKVSKLSGGQKQRLNVIIALLNKPQVLFLDEFTTGLDIAIKNNIQNFIIEYCKKNQTSLILVSHDIDSIDQMTDRVIILADKQIKVDATKKEIIERFGNLSKFLRKYIIY